ncbi:uncharacterized protein LOC124722279 [Schistocerca piceifrons]|uniref:uncharacterized protein LOC124722279 n=1 Tax=Schistocerca piceifrons TaxID=274613 RepID=UPI001F5E8615|nr:uncharacterized protein LOC124722279 [Schistocerca piceifrons]
MFDDKPMRAQRKEIDNLAPISEIFDNFVDVSKKSYSAGALTMIDELSEPFHGRCKFRQYIANEPAKYGIKVPECFIKEKHDDGQFILHLYHWLTNVHQSPTHSSRYSAENRRDIPPELLDIKCRQLNSSIFAFGEKPSNICLICSYIPKKKQKKNVLMLSSMHSDDAIGADSGKANKPEVIMFYNLT